MIELAVVAGLLTGLCALLVLDRRRRSPDVDALIGLCDRLCQRLQAPATAVLEHHQTVDRPGADAAPAAVHPDDDADYWESREALADRLMDEEREAAANGR